jgi:SseB protein N-terminal domain
VLGGGESRFRGDDGSAEPRAAAALMAYGSGRGSEHAALTALASSRLLVPVIARVSGIVREQGSAREGGGAGRVRAGGGARGAEMSVPTLIGRDGRPAVPAFTCLDALARWRPEARPVPAAAGQVWRAAVDDSCAVVVDVAGPVPLAIDGARLAALADGQPVPLPHQDPDVLTAVRAAAAQHPSIAGLRIASGDPGSDLQVQVTIAAGGAPGTAGEVIRLLGTEVMARLGGRLRRGIAVAVVPR